MTNDHAPSRTFRLNCDPSDAERVESLLQAEGFVLAQDPCYSLARGLISGPTALGNALAHTFGYIYIQDRSSMLPPLLLDPPKGGVVLDMCASPGSKSTLLARLVGPQGLVVANEVNPTRLGTLRANLRAQNLPNVVTICQQGQDLPLDEGTWPFILVDAPCSGWGTVDKNPQVMQVWTPDKLAPLVQLQKSILARAARLLAPGGTLVYSTCTTDPLENEQQVRWAVDHLGLQLEHLDPLPGFTVQRGAAPELDHCLLIDGRKSGAQGFFVARLSKPGRSGQPADLPVKTGMADHAVPVKQLTTAHPLNENALKAGTCHLFRDKVFFLHHKALQRLAGRVRWQGLPLGTLRKDRFRIDPTLHCLMPGYDTLGGLNVTDIDILHKMISGQSLPAPGSGKHGGLYWRGLPLGWLKYKGKRCLWSNR
ncbi:RsmB/NOP family class I SAM-dependent RNA methyltransferase [Desulfoplanes formicivorans]|uniref:Fmu (Sun) domain protein n=1 Tax=Desulfoplanes formicivorans TaxID=1592317 RepID=A0A194AHP7_9BACT|nr:RsmB/NOP family class I SAM-dependent RNA methyltransferase [Desulfoplanes formicivorans]GAU08848.1 Fmu (Sun) domain protein [Desulfoplanes formicivorans]